MNAGVGAETGAVMAAIVSEGSAAPQGPLSRSPAPARVRRATTAPTGRAPHDRADHHQPSVEPDGGGDRTGERETQRPGDERADHVEGVDPASLSSAMFCWMDRSQFTLKISSPNPCRNAPTRTGHSWSLKGHRERERGGQRQHTVPRTGRGGAPAQADQAADEEPGHQRGRGEPPGRAAELVPDDDRPEDALGAAVEQVVEQGLADEQPQPGVAEDLLEPFAEVAEERRTVALGPDVRDAKQREAAAAAAYVAASTAIAQPGADAGDEYAGRGEPEDLRAGLEQSAQATAEGSSSAGTVSRVIAAAEGPLRAPRQPMTTPPGRGSGSSPSRRSAVATSPGTPRRRPRSPASSAAGDPSPSTPPNSTVTTSAGANAATTSPGPGRPAEVEDREGEGHGGRWRRRRADGRARDEQPELRCRNGPSRPAAGPRGEWPGDDITRSPIIRQRTIVKFPTIPGHGGRRARGLRGPARGQVARPLDRLPFEDDVEAIVVRC